MRLRVEARTRFNKLSRSECEGIGGIAGSKSAGLVESDGTRRLREVELGG